jgi:hypothetical protein
MQGLVDDAFKIDCPQAFQFQGWAHLLPKFFLSRGSSDSVSRQVIRTSHFHGDDSMKTTFALFLTSLTISLLLTPLVSKLGVRFGIVDLPSKRKVHDVPIPRIGGVAIFLSFLLPVAGWLFVTDHRVSFDFLLAS